MGKQRTRIGGPKEVLAADQRRERIEAVVKLYLKGKSVLDISKLRGVPRQAIYHDLRVARKIWRKRNDQAAESLIAEEVAKIDRMESELWEQWELSKQDATELTIERGADKKIAKRSKKTKGQTAEARYLELALKCVDKRCRLLKIGEYATEETGAMVGMLVEVVVENPEEVAAIMNYRDYETLTQPSVN